MAQNSTNKLSARSVQTAQIKDKDYKLSDGGGLYLFVRKTGSKSWLFLLKRVVTGRSDVEQLAKHLYRFMLPKLVN